MTTYTRPDVSTPALAATLIESEMVTGCLNENVIGPQSVVAEALRTLIGSAHNTASPLAARSTLLGLSNWCRAQAVERLESALDPMNTVAGAAYDQDKAAAFEALARITDGFMDDRHPIPAV
jgi:hypothetical protein